MKTPTHLNTPELKDLKKSIPKIEYLSKEFQQDILEFIQDACNDCYDEGKEDIDEEPTGIKWAYFEYEDVTSWNEFVAKRDELFKKHLNYV